MDTNILFPTPLDATCTLRHDQGWTSLGQPYVHPSGRKGQAFTIPADTPNGHGCRRTVAAPGYVTVEERGLLLQVENVWLFMSDDVVLQEQPAGRLPRLVVQGKFLAQQVPE